MTRINLIDLKERIALDRQYTPAERDFLLDAINEASSPPPRVELHAPPNYLGRIDHLFAALSLDEGGEGVCAAPLGNTGITAALVGADKIRFDTYMRPLAAQIAKLFGKPVRIAKFSQREDIEIIQP